MARNRPTLFVGSSSEGLKVAKAVQVLLDDSCEVTIWSQGIFGLSLGTLESLVNALDDFDFAALVLTPDDLLTTRNESSSAPRDNVLFELGLFMGALGRTRTFIIYDRTAKLKLPSDLAGVTAATFEPHLSSGNLQSALGAATTQLEGQITRLGVRDAERLKLPPEAAQGVGSERRVSPQDAARAELERIPLQYTLDNFVESAASGDLSAVKLFLAAGMNPNVKNRECHTALMCAIRGGHTDIVEALIKAKANVNEKCEGSDPAVAVIWAVDHDRRDALSLLLDQGIDQNMINSAFLRAAGGGKLEVLRMLLNRGADTHLSAEALINACFGGNNEADLNDVIRFLLEQGADVDAKNNHDMTALAGAAFAGNASIVQTLLNAGANIDLKCSGYYFGSASERGWTALMYALRNENTKVADTLLTQGADPNHANSEGTTALIMASSGGQIDSVHALLAKGADANARDNTGATALVYAAAIERGVPIIRALLEKHVDVNARDNHESTAIIYAARSGSVDNIEALLEAGADLHSRDSESRTALMLGAGRGNIKVVKALLSRGAEVNDEDANGKTVLNYAEEDAHMDARRDMVRILMKVGANARGTA